MLNRALSRSDKKILHIDPNDFYGGPEAAFSLQEAEEWARDHQRPETQQDDAPSGPAASNFRSASVTRPPPDAETSNGNTNSLSFPRAYSLALAPQLIHARSQLASQLVSSRVFRQLEFLAVGSFFVLRRLGSSSSPSEDDPQQEPERQRPLPCLELARIPSTREDVFSDGFIPARAKRSLMKFLKFVLDFDSPPQTDLWRDMADSPLSEFLEKIFKLGADLRAYVLALTLSLDGRTTTTREGLTTIYRHLTSMGMFGPGFAAVYPKWGGLGEIAQVACRSCAVGGGIYMLGTGISSIKPAAPHPDPASGGEGELAVELSNGVTVKTKLLVRGAETAATPPEIPATASVRDSSRTSINNHISRLVAVIGSPLSGLFETVVEGAPIPAVAVIACPPGSLNGAAGEIASQDYPVYVMVHSTNTGECPSGQTILYLTTRWFPSAKQLLEQSISPILTAVYRHNGEAVNNPSCLYQLYYEQSSDATSDAGLDGRVFTFPAPSLALAFDDCTLTHVQEAWRAVMGLDIDDQDESEYMKFTDREGTDDDDDG